ncbi:MAG: agmatinase [Bauldia sp.]|nr:agmatinase [Bauldia sp.]
MVSGSRPTDNAFLGSLTGGSLEPTYGGALSFMRRRYTRELDGVDLVVWGVPFDTAVSNRPGARFGPAAIRRASAIFDGDPQFPFGIDPFATLKVVDYGDCSFDYGRPAETPRLIETEASAILASGAQLFTLGGDHFVTYPLLKAHVARHGPLALVQFDAHQDTWPDDGGRIDHGSFVGRAVREGLIDPAASVQIGVRTHAPEDCGIEILDGRAIDSIGVEGIVKAVRTRVGSRKAYLTFDIDCLDPAFAPGTGTPVSGGMSSREALAILHGLSGIDFVGGDVMEVSPPYDHADITAIAAATVAMTYIGILATKRGAQPASRRK